MPLPRSDFSGEFALNLEASTLAGGAASVRSAILRIEQREEAVRIDAEFQFDDTSFKYSLDPASLRWDGDALAFAHESGDVRMWWRYELQDSGKRLTATERMRGGGRHEDNVWVFNRR